ncbi:hypothetical protein [Streptomyces ziwulingensis]|uniref:Uncharacterized protein n=1 Tax=Streptomyces ziwulingensis TaxID=1045501 RepID=A0ABP9D3X3_9ACTN
MSPAEVSVDVALWYVTAASGATAALAALVAARLTRQRRARRSQQREIQHVEDFANHPHAHTRYGQTRKETP